MAPLIDVVFLLLLFFFVAAKWRPQEDFLPFRLPAAQAQSRPLAKPEPMLVNIAAQSAGCIVRIDAAEQLIIDDESLEADLTAMLETIRASMLTRKRLPADPVEIICEPDVKWQHLARVYNLLYGAGMTDITFWMTE